MTGAITHEVAHPMAEPTFASPAPDSAFRPHAGAFPFEQLRGPRAAIDFIRPLTASRGDGFGVVLSGTGSTTRLGAKGAKGRPRGGGRGVPGEPQEFFRERRQAEGLLAGGESRDV
jgi:hypothetical protein